MTLRSDHIAGAAFVAFGILIIALSGDLPFGQLSMPGSGFMPRILAVLTILFGLILILRAAESAPSHETSWSDGKHALMVTVATAAAILLYTELGFVITMGAMMIGVLVVIERRNPLYAAAYTLAIVLVTYAAFVYLLKTPLPESPFSF
jgi:Tripartite tricarboxylate transporter TctB family